VKGAAHTLTSISNPLPSLTCVFLCLCLQGRTSLSVGTPVLRAVANLLAGGDPTWTEAVLRCISIKYTFLSIHAHSHSNERIRHKSPFRRWSGDKGRIFTSSPY
jgi:hypothetical protein